MSNPNNSDKSGKIEKPVAAEPVPVELASTEVTVITDHTSELSSSLQLQSVGPEIQTALEEAELPNGTVAIRFQSGEDDSKNRFGIVIVTPLPLPLGTSEDEYDDEYEYDEDEYEYDEDEYEYEDEYEDDEEKIHRESLFTKMPYSDWGYATRQYALRRADRAQAAINEKYPTRNYYCPIDAYIEVRTSQMNGVSVLEITDFRFPHEKPESEVKLSEVVFKQIVDTARAQGVDYVRISPYRLDDESLIYQELVALFNNNSNGFYFPEETNNESLCRDGDLLYLYKPLKEDSQVTTMIAPNERPDTLRKMIILKNLIISIQHVLDDENGGNLVCRTAIMYIAASLQEQIDTNPNGSVPSLLDITAEDEFSAMKALFTKFESEMIEIAQFIKIDNLRSLNNMIRMGDDDSDL